MTFNGKCGTLETDLYPNVLFEAKDKHVYSGGGLVFQLSIFNKDVNGSYYSLNSQNDKSYRGVVGVVRVFPLWIIRCSSLWHGSGLPGNVLEYKGLITTQSRHEYYRLVQGCEWKIHTHTHTHTHENKTIAVQLTLVLRCLRAGYPLDISFYIIVCRHPRPCSQSPLFKTAGSGDWERGYVPYQYT